LANNRAAATIVRTSFDFDPAMHAAAETIDGQIDVVTPENVAFQYQVAGPFRRLPAYLVDFFIRLLIMFLLGITLSLLARFTFIEHLGTAFILIAFFVIGNLYGGLFEAFWNGQTPGKRMMGLRVLTVDGRPINALQAVLRNLLRDVDTMPYALSVFGYDMQLVGFYWVGIITMSLNDRYQRLGDLAAGTMVVVETRSHDRGLIMLRDPAVLLAASLLPVDFEVTRSLGKALSLYVARRASLSPLRRAEIARHLAVPLMARLRLPGDTNYDLLLCALYQRAFADPNGDLTAELASAPRRTSAQREPNLNDFLAPPFSRA
jgi:uncharacterized RDD family membrane protein YckC